MSMTDTNSNHSDWIQFYQRAIDGQPPGGGGGGGGAGGAALGGVSPVVQSTVGANTSPTTTVTGTVHSNIEGRVGKSARRRSRASRKAPTTLLNTDTTNFRAMVQQFTGVPPAPFQSGYNQATAVGGGGGPATLNFGLGVDRVHQSMALPFGVQQQQYHHHRQQPYQHDGPAIFMLGGGARTTTATTTTGNDVFFQVGFDNATRGNVEIPDGFLLEGISSSQMMPRPAASTTDSRTTEGFL